MGIFGKKKTLEVEKPETLSGIVIALNTILAKQIRSEVDDNGYNELRGGIFSLFKSTIAKPKDVADADSSAEVSEETVEEAVEAVEKVVEEAIEEVAEEAIEEVAEEAIEEVADETAEEVSENEEVEEEAETDADVKEAEDITESDEIDATESDEADESVDEDLETFASFEDEPDEENEDPEIEEEDLEIEDADSEETDEVSEPETVEESPTEDEETDVSETENDKGMEEVSESAENLVEEESEDAELADEVDEAEDSVKFEVDVEIDDAPEEILGELDDVETEAENFEEEPEEKIENKAESLRSTSASKLKVAKINKSVTQEEVNDPDETKSSESTPVINSTNSNCEECDDMNKTELINKRMEDTMGGAIPSIMPEDSNSDAEELKAFLKKVGLLGAVQKMMQEKQEVDDDVFTATASLRKLTNGYNEAQALVVTRFDSEGYDITKYVTPEHTPEQMRIIGDAIKERENVTYITDVTLSCKQMLCLLELQRDYEIEEIADSKYHPLAMKAYCHGKKLGLEMEDIIHALTVEGIAQYKHVMKAIELMLAGISSEKIVQVINSYDTMTLLLESEHDDYENITYTISDNGTQLIKTVAEPKDESDEDDPVFDDEAVFETEKGTSATLNADSYEFANNTADEGENDEG